MYKSLAESVRDVVLRREERLEETREMFKNSLLKKIKDGYWEADQDVVAGKHVMVRDTKSNKKFLVYVNEEVEHIQEVSWTPKDKKMAEYVRKNYPNVASDLGGNLMNFVADVQVEKMKAGSIASGYSTRRTSDKNLEDLVKKLRGLSKDQNLEEKAVSKSQQRLFGMALAYKRGETDDVPPKVKSLAKSMSEKDLEDYAKTKHSEMSEAKAAPEDSDSGADMHVMAQLRKIGSLNRPGKVDLGKKKVDVDARTARNYVAAYMTKKTSDQKDAFEKEVTKKLLGESLDLRESKENKRFRVLVGGSDSIGSGSSVFDSESEAKAHARKLKQDLRYGAPDVSIVREEKKAPVTKKDDDGKGMDPVGHEDKDVDNDGDSDSSDKYLKNRRKKITKAVSKDKEKLDGKKEPVDVDPELKEEFRISVGSKVAMKTKNGKMVYGKVSSTEKVMEKPGVVVKWEDGTTGRFPMSSFSSVSGDSSADYKISEFADLDEVTFQKVEKPKFEVGDTIDYPTKVTLKRGSDYKKIDLPLQGKIRSKDLRHLAPDPSWVRSQVMGNSQIAKMKKYGWAIHDMSTTWDKNKYY